jgi:prepilin-type N-terminal cleavage/methylation domain-containing protein/prepilin-type processing-associated H-X9-DG protein
MVARRRAFTLVELLVVIAIIAILIAILLPSLRRAKEAGLRITCASNMRAIGQAFVMYAQENKGFFPRPGTEALPEDWIYWQRGRNIDESRISRMIAKTFQTKLFVCPSDDVTTHPVVAAYGVSFPCSYTVNGYICIWNKDYKTLKMSEVLQPSSKILLIDESGNTVDDGCWAPSHFDSPTDRKNMLSNRHDKLNEKKNAKASYDLTDKIYGRGNVTFCDGHCEFFDRNEAFKQRHYNPKWNGRDDPNLP